MRYSRPGGTPKSRTGGGTAGARDIFEEDEDTVHHHWPCIG